MRLIDADALRDALGITGTNESCKGCQYNKRFNFACNTDDAPSFAYVCEAIDEAPTVDAVPIEWIKMRIKGLRGQLANADEDDKDLIWDLRTKIDELGGITEYWGKKHETD